LITKSEWIVTKVSFLTILNRMLSNKMRIKAFYQQQESKLKGKLFDLLKRNSEFMAAQREMVEKVAVEFSKARLVKNLRKEIADRRAEEEV
jgi:nucleoid-associated protein YejK